MRRIHSIACHDSLIGLIHGLKLKFCEKPKRPPSTSVVHYTSSILEFFHVVYVSCFSQRAGGEQNI